jgi:hypothetical protein
MCIILLMQAVSTHILTDMLARAMGTVLSNDELNVAMGVFSLGQNTANSEVKKIIKPLHYSNMVQRSYYEPCSYLYRHTCISVMLTHIRKLTNTSMLCAVYIRDIFTAGIHKLWESGCLDN